MIYHSATSWRLLTPPLLNMREHVIKPSIELRKLTNHSCNNVLILISIVMGQNDQNLSSSPVSKSHFRSQKIFSLVLCHSFLKVSCKFWKIFANEVGEMSVFLLVPWNEWQCEVLLCGVHFFNPFDDKVNLVSEERIVNVWVQMLSVWSSVLIGKISADSPSLAYLSSIVESNHWHLSIFVLTSSFSSSEFFH